MLFGRMLFGDICVDKPDIRDLPHTCVCVCARVSAFYVSSICQGTLYLLVLKGEGNWIPLTILTQPSLIVLTFPPELPA